MDEDIMSYTFEEGNPYTFFEAWERVMDAHCGDTEWEDMDGYERIILLYERHTWRQNIHAINADMTPDEIRARNRNMARLYARWCRWKKEHPPEPFEDGEVPF